MVKAVILAAGGGSHLRPAPLHIPKALVPVANRPVVAHVLDALRTAGITEVAVVVENHDGPLARWPGWRRQADLKVTFLEQSLPLGIAHAVRMGERFVGTETFLVMTGDCLLDGSLADFVDRHRAERPAASVLLARTDHPGDFGVVQVRNEQVTQVLEKPQRPAGDLVLAGAYIFDHRIFGVIDVIRPSPRNELELTGAIQTLIERGLAVRGQVLDGFWRDAGRPEDILAANVHWLDRLEGTVRGQVTRTRMEGRVAVGERARVMNSTILGPAVIGDGSAVINAWIGPYTALGEHVVVEDAEVERSVILDNCRIKGAGRLEGCLIGAGSRVGRRAGRPQAHRLVLGEGNEIEVG